MSIFITTLVIVLTSLFSKPEQEVKPKTLNMQLVCVTPHGHQVYSYPDGKTTIYVVIRHADGIPLGISTK